jgi:hypothetical protein
MTPRRHTCWLTLLIVLSAAHQSGFATEVDDPPYLGVLSSYYENDVIVGQDQNYTSGVGFSWTSDDVGRYSRKNFMRKVVHAFSFLPKIEHDDYRSLLSFTLGQEMYTPEDIAAPVPPPDQQPYAGVLFLDTTVYAHGRQSMHAYTLRVGCVGPCSGAAGLQEWIHDWTPAPIPEGWDHQLSNEPLLNFDYQYYRRLLRSTRPRRPHFDIAAHVGGGLGNYFTGANAGVVARLGYPLPDNYSVANLRFGGGSWLVGMTPPSRGSRWYGYVFIGLEGIAVARFLPTDGNTFKDSPSVEREDFFGNLSSGLVVGYRRLLFSWKLTNLRGLVRSSDSNTDDYGTFTLSWYFGGKAR